MHCSRKNVALDGRPPALSTSDNEANKLINTEDFLRALHFPLSYLNTSRFQALDGAIKSDKLDSLNIQHTVNFTLGNSP